MILYCHHNLSRKTTLARLLFRLYDVSSGAILVNNKDVKEYRQESYRKSIGVVPQDTVLFNDTLGFNLRYGDPSCYQEDLETVVDLAQLGNFLHALPEGYDTRVGDR